MSTRTNHNESAGSKSIAHQMVLDDPDALRFMANPIRWEIIDALTSLGECSAADIADFTARARTSLYPHLQGLLEHGLIHESGTRLMGKRYEQLYVPAAHSIDTRFIKDDPDNIEFHVTLAKAAARLCSRRMERAMRHEDANPRTKKRNLHLNLMNLWVSPSELAELNEMIDRISKMGRDSRPGDGKSLIHLTLFQTPHLNRDD